MEKKKVIKRLSIFTVVVAIFGMSLCITGCENKKKAMDSNSMRVYFINVGKGDCALLQFQNKNYLIDTGYEETADEVELFLRDHNVATIDGIILSHYDKDHVGGAADIIHNFTVEAIYMPEYVDSGNKYAEFMEKVELYGLQDKINYVKEDQTITEGKVTIDLFACKETYYEQENDYSLVAKVNYDKDTYLFAGDAEKARFKELLTYDEATFKADVLKIPHHGGYNKKVDDFVELVAPKYAVSTSETEDTTEQELKDIMTENNITCYYTCNGTIVCESNGKGEYKWETLK